jgi:hypothetical protein
MFAMSMRLHTRLEVLVHMQAWHEVIRTHHSTTSGEALDQPPGFLAVNLAMPFRSFVWLAFFPREYRCH